eukprot:Phypoly_transcript_22881.p1 GENE.Phypoly_transcript_22881~~Phypoly_transcript_22881.p1  ORF type:complete len:146 (+),score=26.77 Phypoly_transcript_22881:86-523(+)
MLLLGELMASKGNDLDALLEQKADIEQKLASLERQIYALEGSYLEDTHHLGNIIRGWDGYLSSRSGALKRLKFKESDRLFSMSSVTAIKNPENLILEYSGEDSRPAKRPREDTSPTPQKASKKNMPGRPRKGYSNDEEEESEVDV